MPSFIQLHRRAVGGTRFGNAIDEAGQPFMADLGAATDQDCQSQHSQGDLEREGPFQSSFTIVGRRIQRR